MCSRRAANTLVATLPVGLAPQGLALDTDRQRLLVHNFLSRSMMAFDLSQILAGTTYLAPRLYDVATVTSEALTPEVLHGKRIFYNASDPRMSRDGYLSCASCHLDGDADGQVWDFTQDGEGLRNTISLLGRQGTGHGNLHWTANFDEVQDFEHDIRQSFGGRGFLSAPQFAAAPTPLGPTKQGMNSDLDALAAYVASLARFPASPFARVDPGPRPAPDAAPDASQSPVARGRALFQRLACATCHTPPSFTDGQRHDVGTIQTSSGLGLGQSLLGQGFETPTLRGLWATAPYLHNGQAPRLTDVLNSARHGGTDTLTPRERTWLAAYLLSIE